MIRFLAASRISRAVILAVTFGIFISSGAFAQTTLPNVSGLETVSPALSAPPPSPNDIRELMRLLGDPSIRNWLAEGARSTSENGGDDAKSVSIRESLSTLISSTSARIGELEALWTDIAMAPGMVIAAWQSQLSQTETLRTITYALIFLFIGGALEWLYNQYTKYRLLQIEFMNPDRLRPRVKANVTRTFYNLVGILCFAIGSIGAFLTFDWPELVKDIVLDFLLAVLIFRLFFTLSRNLFAPRLKNLRVVPLNSRQTKITHRWVVALGAVGITSLFIVNVFKQTFSIMQEGAPSSAALSVGIVGNAIWAFVALAAIWNLRPYFSTKSENETPKRGKMGNPWPAFLTLMVILVLLLWILDAGALMGSVIVFGLFFPALKLVSIWIDNLYDQAEGLDQLHGNKSLIAAVAEPMVEDADGEEEPSEQEETDEETSSQELNEEHYSYKIYRSITRRVARFILVALAIMGLVFAWGINLFELSNSQSVGGIIFDVIIDTIFAVLLADLIWHWAKLVIDRRMADYVPPPDGQAPGPEARMATLLPLLRMILMITLLAIVALSVLTSFGINIGPLLAGAGVLGVAIGFGAQALVRDVVSGIFFLIDDAFRIGEYIEIDDLRGTVEAMSIRSLRVRHHRGMVHTIPFGELKSLTNYSRDWVIMKLEFRVPFDTDLKLVKKIVKKIGAELLENETYGKGIIQTLKSQGVRRMEEFNMVVGVKFMAKPGEQWLIRRDAYQKVRDAFDANGIGFAERNVKVEVLGDQNMDEATKKAAIGAAQNAIDQQLPPLPLKDEP